jgi:hypothetical protein
MIPPDVTAIREWTGATVADVSDDQIQTIIDAESKLQIAYCLWPNWLDVNLPDGEMPDSIYQALLRRCARALAARGVPLGSLPAVASGLGAEYGLPGAGLLPRYDAEIERYEAPYRVAGIA